MLWAILAVMSAIVYAVSNIIDRFQVTKQFKRHFNLIAITVVVSGVISLALIPFSSYSGLGTMQIVLGFITGALVIPTLLMYYKALKIEEVSTVVGIWAVEPIFVLVLAFVFLGESFGPLKYAGVFLITIGAVLLQLRVTKARFGMAFWLMLGAAVFEAVEIILLKYLLGFAGFTTIFSLTRFGMFAIGLPILILSIGDITKVIKKKGLQPLGMAVVGEILGISAAFLFVVAISVGYATLVTALAYTQPLFVLVMAALVGYFFPKIIDERVSRKLLAQRLISMALIIIGGIIVAL
ncbi:MAG TPA: DMT family transporter [Candidatus Baltobacteraceae bacterium]|nr:DMT family transporter [Candidatus Baltobacteraceae bacterium]